jgi:twitching motility protein PilT
MSSELTRLLRFAVDQGASDVHISAGEPPILRIDGDLRRLDTAPLKPEQTELIVIELMSEEQREELQKRLELDFAFELSDGQRFRVNAFLQNRGYAAVFRAIPMATPNADALGLPPAVLRLSDLEKGLVLVTGPTGSGKSTTLGALVDRINSTRAAHVLTLEDPIELVHAPKRALINQREVGAQTHSFAAAMRSALREDPDVILVGELRDLETTQLALSAAETGHLVLATLHTASAPKTVDRIIDMFPAAQQAQVRAMLSESLVAAISQMLVKRIGGGRAAALEILLGTPAVRNLIRENKIHQIASAMQVGGAIGMQTMESALAGLVSSGLVDMEEARRRMPGSEMIAMLGRSARQGVGA